MNVQLLQTFYDTAPLSMQCNQSDGHKFPVSRIIDWLIETNLWDEYNHGTTGRHLSYRITQCYLPPDTSERAPPNFTQ